MDISCPISNLYLLFLESLMSLPTNFIWALRWTWSGGSRTHTIKIVACYMPLIHSHLTINANSKSLQVPSFIKKNLTNNKILHKRWSVIIAIKTWWEGPFKFDDVVDSVCKRISPLQNSTLTSPSNNQSRNR